MASSLEAFADAPPPVVRFGDLPVPTRPFAAALVEDPVRAAAVVGDVAPSWPARPGSPTPRTARGAPRPSAGCSSPSRRTSSRPIPRSPPATWRGSTGARSRTRPPPRQDRLAAQTGLLEVARRNGIDEIFRLEVRQAAARAALAVAFSPSPDVERGLLAAGRGDARSAQALQARNPRLLQVVAEAAKGGVGGGGLFLAAVRRRVEAGAESFADL